MDHAPDSGDDRRRTWTDLLFRIGAVVPKAEGLVSLSRTEERAELRIVWPTAAIVAVVLAALAGVPEIRAFAVWVIQHAPTLPR